MRTRNRSVARLNSFPRLLFAEWRKLKLPVSDSPIIVAVSGGADSTALLLALDELNKAQKLSVTICVAHLDHGIRPGSKRDARVVSQLGKTLGVRVVIGKPKAGAEATANADNLEQTARRLRYEFLEKTAKRLGAVFVLTGHTMDDQAETVLFRLIRGSAGHGLSGMDAVRLISKGSRIHLVR